MALVKATTRRENADGSWTESTVDINGLMTRYVTSKGLWSEFIYDKKGRLTRYANSDQFWIEVDYSDNNEEEKATDQAKYVGKDSLCNATKLCR